MKLKKLTLFFPILTLSALTFQSSAQEKQEQNDSEQTESYGIEVINVTAQRRSESLQEAAIPINAASGARLERQGISDAVGLNKIAPALSVANNGGANTAFFIRGVGNFTNNGFTNPAVSFNIDGVYIGRPLSTISSFLDLDRVEVLKGPQGTLYGRNSTGGAINVISKAPVLNENSGKFTVGIGNYSSYNISAIGNIELTDSSALRLAGIISDRDGYFEDGTSDADDTAFRVSYFNEVSDDMTVRVTADYASQKGVGAGTEVQGYYSFSAFQGDLPVPNWSFNAVPDDIAGDFLGLHNPNVLEFIRENAVGAPGHMPFEGYAYPNRNDEFWGVSAEINYSLDWAKMTIIPAYRVSTLDNIFNGPPFKAAINEDEAKQSSLEIRLAGEAGSIDWILGAFYFDESVEGTNAYNQFSTLTSNDWESDTESSSIFARGTYNLSEDLRLVAGIRYTKDEYSLDATQTSTAVVCLESPEGRPPFCPQIPSLPVGLTLEDTLSALDPTLFPAGSPLNDDGTISYGVYPFGPINYFAPAQFGPGAILAITPTITNNSQDDSQVTYRAAVEYDIAKRSMVYASFESGYRAGGFNQTKGRETYEPEHIDAYTLGSKNRFLDNKLELNVEAFYWEYEDQQLAALGLDIDGNNGFYTRNVGTSTIKGLEVDFQYAISAQTLLRGNAQFLNAKYDKYEYDQVDLSDAGIDPPNFLTPINTCENTLGIYDGDQLVAYDPALDVVGARRGFTVDCSGKDAINAPDFTLTLGIQHTVEFDGFALIGNFDARYRDERELGFNYVPGGRADSDLTLDATLTYISNDGDWTVNAYVRNLTNEIMASTYELGAGNVAASAYEPPRTYGINVTYEF